MMLYERQDNEWVKIDTYLQRFNPERSISSAAQAVHKISFEMVAMEPTFKESVGTIKTFLERSQHVVAHNLKFDMGFLIAEFAQADEVLPNLKGVDTCEARWATPYGKVPNLGELCFALNVGYNSESAHSAEYDVDVLAKCFIRGLELGFFRLEEE